MKIEAWNENFTEANHLINVPMVFLAHIKKGQRPGIKNPKKDVIITNPIIGDNTIVVIKGYWMKNSEYKLWEKAFKNVDIDLNCEVEMIYIEGLIHASEKEKGNYYKGVISFKHK